jgi:hypothetical protein
MHRRQTHYQLSYRGELVGGSFYEIYEVTVKRVENKMVYYEETAESPYLIFWPGS